MSRCCFCSGGGKNHAKRLMSKPQGSRPTKNKGGFTPRRAGEDGPALQEKMDPGLRRSMVLRVNHRNSKASRPTDAQKCRNLPFDSAQHEVRVSGGVARHHKRRWTPAFAGVTGLDSGSKPGMTGKTVPRASHRRGNPVVGVRSKSSKNRLLLTKPLSRFRAVTGSCLSGLPRFYSSRSGCRS